jgi:hypothetical protein
VETNIKVFLQSLKNVINKDKSEKSARKIEQIIDEKRTCKRRNAQNNLLNIGYL